jgi:hypothetical protein
VPQADLALANLTVSETIDYAIKLRIPDVTKEKMKEIRSIFFFLHSLSPIIPFI